MKDSTMSVADKEEEIMPPQESSPTDDEEQDEGENSPFEHMQTELHSRGAELTKAWSNLFSFITKYQAELVVKENSVEIAEKEIEQRKKQLEEMKPVVDAGNEEITQLQDEIRTKEGLLSKAQSQLSVKERMLQRVQSDLSCNMEMLEKSRSELLGKQNELIRYRGDLGRLKSELTIKQEQIQIKDNLLKKLQNQLMKENTELKEQLELERRALQLEKQSHELTKRTMVSHSGSRKRLRTSEGPAAVIEIPDSPPTLDLSVEGDFGLSNIISLAESQATEQDSSAQTKLSSGRDNSRISNTSQSFSDHSSRLHHMPTSTTPSKWGFSTPPKVAPSPSKFMASPSVTPPQTSQSSIGDNIPMSDTTAMTSSDTFFPLSVSEDLKPGFDTLTYGMQMDSDSQGNMPITKPGTPSSGTSDSNQGPVPVSGPIQSPGMSPGGSIEGGADGKANDSDMMTDDSDPVESEDLGSESDPEPGVIRCDLCDLGVSSMQDLQVHRRTKHFDVEHVRKEPLKCTTCGKTFRRTYDFQCHILVHRNQALDSQSYGPRNCRCETCNKLFQTPYDLQRHMGTHSVIKPFGCPNCSVEFKTKVGLKCHMARQCKAPNYAGLRNEGIVLQPDECYFCRKSFGTRSRMKKHLSRHTNENPLECPICHKKFSSKGNRNKHMKTHVDGNAPKDVTLSDAFKDVSPSDQDDDIPTGINVLQRDECCFCRKLFGTRSLMQEHLATHTDENPLQCPICSKTFSLISNRNRHINTHVAVKDFWCGTCEKGFGTKYDLQKHMMSRNHELRETGKGEEAAREGSHSQDSFFAALYIGDEQTPSVAPGRSSNVLHESSDGGKLESMETSKAENDDPVPGPSTENVSEKPWNLLPEITWETYECDICRYAFMSQKLLDAHRRKHTGEKPYLCSICGNGYQNRSGLWKHMALHPLEERPVTKDTQCHICQKKFRSWCFLRDHLRVHTGERPFICETCGKAFKSRTVLRTHMATHKKKDD